jgi:hypothetical protein
LEHIIAKTRIQQAQAAIFFIVIFILFCQLNSN